jgi:hypothetical protein
MFADQEFNRCPLFVGELEPIEYALREPDAFLGVIGFSPLPDIVKQQSQRQQFGGSQLLKNGGKAAAAPGRRFQERLDAANREQRVLVNGVLVIEVADDPALDLCEFREDAIEQAAVVHFRQAIVEAGPRREQPPDLQAVPFGRHEIVGGAAMHVLLDEGQRRL